MVTFKSESQIRAETIQYERGYFRGLQVGVFGMLLVGLAIAWAFQA